MTLPTDTSYTAQALRTESPITEPLQFRLQYHARLLHAVLGLLTEAGELADPIKKHIYYSRPLDTVNLREEIGDCLWYLAIAADALGTTLEAEQARNLAKLRARYPHVFTAEAAQVRDLDRERQVLEKAEVEKLQGAMAADDQRLRDAEERVWPGRTLGCDAPDAMADEILHLRQQLDAAQVTILAQRAGIELQHRVVDLLEAKVKSLQRFAERIRTAHHSDNWPSIGMALDALDAETEPAPATDPQHEEFWVWQQQFDDAHAIIVSRLEQELDDARATILSQKRGNQYLRLLIERVRGIVNRDDAMSDRLEQISQAIDDFDAGSSELAAATEPARCPECETTIQQLAEANKQWQLVAQQREQDRTRLREYEQIVAQSNSAMDAARKKIAEQEAQVAGLNDKLAAKTLGEGTEHAPATEKRWFRSQVQIDECRGRTTDGEDHWESVTVWVSGQPAEWRQTIRRASGQIPEWLWESLSSQKLYHAETTFNRHTNMMEFRNWEPLAKPAPATAPESNSSATLTGSPEAGGGK